MIYIIHRDKSELKYDLPKNSTLILNDSNDMYLGEIAAWDKIYEDVRKNNYTSVGIYQARRAFHVNNRILTDEDYVVDKNTIYLSKYVFNNETLNQQYKKCHPSHANLLENVTSSDCKQFLNLQYIYPHNMFYCATDTFLEMYDYLNFVKNSKVLQSYKHDSVKFFSFLSERLLTIWVNYMQYNVKLCNVLAYDKNTGKLLYTIDGIDH